MNTDPRQLTLEAIIAGCQRETERFLQSLLSDAAYCYELFRRAIVKKDNEAGNAAIRQFWETTQKKVRKWLTQYEIFRFEPDKEVIVQDCVNDAFGRFWMHYKPAKFMQSRGLPDVLAYLEKCAFSAVGQWVRDIGPVFGELDGPMDTTGIKDDGIQIDELKHLARECFMRHCADELDRQLVRRVACEGMRLEEVLVELREFFPRRQDLYQRWRTFKERVARDETCRQLLIDSRG